MTDEEVTPARMLALEWLTIRFVARYMRSRAGGEAEFDAWVGALADDSVALLSMSEDVGMSDRERDAIDGFREAGAKLLDRVGAEMHRQAASKTGG